ncbi:hypothetical protein AU106_gp243 [Sinorhizobium phage phiM9]|uniref:Uncharacterized protein n=1 Tax=Sinorhizobium phage phiM9 TaxID=1636182 RepID=A0A0F6TGR8_9CAUD|nr:hypothetical protein AU106_gp243 [Sinorhizobium phage phiM9]AKE44874.1 hypothetical protein Sm_phiM9_247 [Sinorhizobium phage phiM9]
MTYITRIAPKIHSIFFAHTNEDRTEMYGPMFTTYIDAYEALEPGSERVIVKLECFERDDFGYVKKPPLVAE